MPEDKDFYLPEQIDEQVDALLQAHHMPDQDLRMAHDLRIILANADVEADAHSLQRVQQQLLQGKHAAQGQSGTNIPSLELIQRRKRERLTRMHKTQKFGPMARVFSILAAALIVAALVGSMLIITHAAQQNKGAGSTITGALKPPVRQPQGIYTSDLDKVFRLNLQTHQAVWQQELPNVSKIIPVRNVVYVLQSSQYEEAVNNVIELDANSGKVLWQHTFTGQNHLVAPDATMVFAQNRLYVNWDTGASNSYLDGKIYVLNASNGSLISVYPHTLGPTMDVNDGILAVANTNVQVYNAITNKLLWQTPKNVDYMMRSLKIVDNLLYVISANNTERPGMGQSYIAVYQVATGKLVWQSPFFAGDALSHFIVDQNILYFGTLHTSNATQPFTGEVYAYNIQSKKQIWSTSVPGGAQEPYAFSNGTVYTAVDQGNGLESHLIALNAATGKIVWKQPLHTIVLDGFSMSNGIIFVGSKAEYSTNGSGSGIQAFDARTGQPLWKSTQFGYENIAPGA
jgi:outer membrane protein assembly factor BamB